MTAITKESIIKELRSLGVKSGDVVFIAADLLRVGFFAEDRNQTLTDWMDILLDVVGKEGTLVIPAYTKSFSRFKKDQNIIFTKNALPDSGALSAAFSTYPGVQRSKHPTNSCFAIGKHAEFILKGHDESSPSYLPYKKVVELKGKNLMIGALGDKRLAPMAMHCAQELLGITRGRWSAGLIQAYYLNDSGVRKLFTRWDVGGCSGGGYKSLGHHIVNNAIVFGFVGRSTAAYIDCEKSLDIFLNIFNQNKKILNCDDTFCRDCFGSPVYRHPFFWAGEIWRKIFSIN